MSGYEPAGSPLDQSQSRDVLPASQYLQERLQERRARNTRPKRSRHTDFGPPKGRDDDIFLNEADLASRARMFDSSPMARSTKGSDLGSSTGGRRRTLGVRDMDDQMDRLTKENFALKLELDHRREHTIRLQEKIEAMKESVAWAEEMKREHQELLQINSQMVSELEQRDKAVEEAMDIICDLEERVADLEERNTHTRPSTAHADSGYAGTESLEHDLPSSPPQLQTQPKTPGMKDRRNQQPATTAAQRLQGALTEQTPARPRREPSILSQQKPSTQALRSVYMENAKRLEPVKSFQSLLSRQEARLDEDGEPVLNSPRLSVLSESSFPSIYSPKNQFSPDRYDWECDDEDIADEQMKPRLHLRTDSIKRVSQWISERDEDEGTPTKSNSISSRLANEMDLPQQQPSAAYSGHYQSLNDALQSVAQSHNGSAQEENLRQAMAHARKPKPSSHSPKPTSFGGPIFGEPLLPPTPDSASTRMLRASRSSLADDRSLLDSTPDVVKGYKPLIQPPGERGLRTAPRQMRSSVEMRSAYASNLQYRHDALDALRQEESSEEDDDAESRPGTRDDFELDYDGFPDGKSILMGTPRRFLKHSKPPVSDMLFDGSQSLPAPGGNAALRRRSSSEHFVNSPARPRLSRMETSPGVISNNDQPVTSGKKTSAETITSPRSTHSTSSGNRTVTQGDERSNRTLSPVTSGPPPTLSPGITSPSRSRMSPSPARRFGQKTVGLIRRLSNSQGSDREKPSLPTLTSTPASAFTTTSNEIKRPKTSHGNERPSRAPVNVPPPRPPSSRETRRPSLQLRTKTEPPTARPSSSAAESDREKRNIFKRSNSQKAQTHEPPPAAASNNSRTGAATKRRGSLRDAVNSARRPWRS